MTTENLTKSEPFNSGIQRMRSFLKDYPKSFHPETIDKNGTPYVLGNFKADTGNFYIFTPEVAIICQSKNENVYKSTEYDLTPIISESLVAYDSENPTPEVQIKTAKGKTEIVEIMSKTRFSHPADETYLRHFCYSNEQKI